MILVKETEFGIKWVRKQLNDKQFLIFSSILVGLTAGFAAVLLKMFVFYIHKIITFEHSRLFLYLIYLFLPLIGIIITTYIIHKFYKGNIAGGTASVMFSIVKRSGFMAKVQMYAHVITSAITVGFGGSAGLESPIVITGSAIGSNFSKTYGLSYKDRLLLLACGASAGIAAAFNAPIAGVLFALEVLLVDAGISAFIPLIIAAAAGALCSKVILGEGILFSFKLQGPFDYTNVPFYIILGILSGYISVYYSRVFTWVEKKFDFKPKRKYNKAIIGGLLLAVLIIIFPPLFGEGYESIRILSTNNANELLNERIFPYFQGNDWFLIGFLSLVMLVKVIAASITINSGGNGGNFTPSLFVGSYLGFCFSKFINLTGLTNLPISNFTLVAMAGVLTGVFHAPLTGIFLIAEITGGYELMIPLMIVAALSYTVSKWYEPLSMDMKNLSHKKGVSIQNKDMALLSSLKIEQIIDRNRIVLSPDMSLRELVDIISHSDKNYFPVITSTKQLVGIIYLDNIREVMFNTKEYDTLHTRDLMNTPKVIVSISDNVIDVMKKFDQIKYGFLPVCRDGYYVGVISKSVLLSEYRSQLVKTVRD
jgi:chloride channel protein, CIC family